MGRKRIELIIETPDQVDIYIKDLDTRRIELMRVLKPLKTDLESLVRKLGLDPSLVKKHKTYFTTTKSKT